MYELPKSPIVGASDIGKVSTAKSSIYFKYFYLLKILLKYFPFVKKEKYTSFFGSRRFKDLRSKNTPHTVPVACRIYTPAHGVTYLHTVQQQLFCTVEIKP